jgi:hypothetical protein
LEGGGILVPFLAPFLQRTREKKFCAIFWGTEFLFRFFAPFFGTDFFGVIFCKERGDFFGVIFWGGDGFFCFFGAIFWHGFFWATDFFCLAAILKTWLREVEAVGGSAVLQVVTRILQVELLADLQKKNRQQIHSNASQKNSTSNSCHSPEILLDQ